MSFPLLCPIRQVIFDPCVQAGSKLFDAVKDSAYQSEFLGLCESDHLIQGAKMIRGPLANSFAILQQIGATFDVIVSDPPEGQTILAKGMPKPSPRPKPGTMSAAPTGRKLFLERAESAEPVAAPTLDLGYATFLLTNALLSSFGEAMLTVGPTSLALIENDMLYSRVWSRSQVGTTSLTRLYIAKDHKPIPGQSPAEATGRHAIRGQCITHLTKSVTSYIRFTAAREEINRRKASDTPAFDITMENNIVRLHTSEFKCLADSAYREAINTLVTFRSKTLVDIAVMRDDRERFRNALKNPKLAVPPALLTAFEDTVRQMQSLTAPFNRPSPVQRVAWLDEQNGIECLSDFCTFNAGQMYAIRTKVIQGKKTEMRHRPGFKQPEEVFVSGQEVLVEVESRAIGDISYGEYKPTHVFTQFPITKDMEQNDEYQPTVRHTLSELIQHFKMPDVQDIAESDPATYLKYVNRLKKLETATA